MPCSSKQQQKRIQLPVTVRQAQKLLAKDSGWGYGSIAEALYRAGFATSVKEMLTKLDRMAQSNPHFLIQEEEYDDYEGAEDYDYDFEEDENEQSGANSPSASDREPTVEDREEGESRPKNTDEVSPQSDNPSDDSNHGGDGNSGEVDSTAQTSSQERRKSRSQPDNGQGLGDGDPMDGAGSHSDRSAGDAPQSSRSETGFSTSEDEGQGGTAQNFTQQAEISPSTAIGDEVRPWESHRDAEKTMAPVNEDQPRDAGRLEVPNTLDLSSSREGDLAKEGCPEKGYPKAVDNDGDDVLGTEEIENGIESTQEQTGCQEDSNSLGESPNSEANQLLDDSPTHQKKWGKKFSKTEKVSSRLSADANSNHGGMTAQLKGIGINSQLLKLCRARLAALTGDSSQDYSPRRDYTEFCVRLKTYRNPQPARKEESGRSIILIMADVSGSCASFSDESVAVAKAASSLGVPGADILVLSHSNGWPCELEHNGEQIDLASIGQQSRYEHAHDNEAWYAGLLSRYQIEAVIALGDWDAANDYVQVLRHPTVNRFIWLDNAHCSSRGFVQDDSKFALKQIAEMGVKVADIRHKLTYKTGCKNARAFIQEIK